MPLPSPFMIWIRLAPHHRAPSFGTTFVSSLIGSGLIDELNLFVNPVAIGKGMRIFEARRPLKMTSSTAYPCGIVVNTYSPR